MTQAIMNVEPKQLSGLASQIRELMPGGNRLTDIEAKSLAQVALLHGLDPFNGEVWYLKYEDGRSIGIMAGIKGHRRAAHRQLDSEGGGNFWIEFDLLTPDEKKSLLIPDNAIAFRGRLFDSITIRQYTETIERLCKSGVPWQDVKSIAGERPTTVGYGYFTPGEKSKMKPHACAMKRTEADALKRRFDLPFGNAVGQNGDVDEVDGDFTKSEQDPAETQARMQAASKQLRGDQGGDDLVSYATSTRVGEPVPDRTPYQPEGMPIISQPIKSPTVPPKQTQSTETNVAVEWPPKLLNGLVMHYRAGTVQEYRARLGKSMILNPMDAADVILHWMDIYNKEREAGVESDEAAKRADADLQATRESA